MPHVKCVGGLSLTPDILLLPPWIQHGRQTEMRQAASPERQVSLEHNNFYSLPRRTFYSCQLGYGYHNLRAAHQLQIKN